MNQFEVKKDGEFINKEALVKKIREASETIQATKENAASLILMNVKNIASTYGQAERMLDEIEREFVWGGRNNKDLREAENIIQNTKQLLNNEKNSLRIAGHKNT